MSGGGNGSNGEAGAAGGASRRAVLGAAAGTPALALPAGAEAAGRDGDGREVSVSEVRVEDPRLRPLLRPGAALVELASELVWAEGCAWIPGLGLVFSDVRSDREMLWRDDGGPAGRVSVRRKPSGHSNGHAADREGRVVACESGRRAVTRTNPDGSGAVVLAERFEGRRLNSPNDVTLAPDGALWFSDPTYGLEKPEEGGPGEAELPHRGVYRLDPATGALRLATDSLLQPNGLAFSPDGRVLYASDTGEGREGVRRFEVLDAAAGRLGPGRLLCRAEKGVVDGLRVDRDGNLWCSSGVGVEVFAPDGARLGVIPVPDTVANLAFGGAEGGRLFLCASSRLLVIDVAACG